MKFSDFYGPFNVQTHFSPTGPDQGTSAGDKSLSTIDAVYMALLCGFNVRIDGRGSHWNSGFGARSLHVQYVELGTPLNSQQVEIYRVDDGQNLTLARTVLGLKAATVYAVRFFLLDEENQLIYLSASHEVVTLAKPVRFGP